MPIAIRSQAHPVPIRSEQESVPQQAALQAQQAA
jgi:hypothetical protein